MRACKAAAQLWPHSALSVVTFLSHRHEQNNIAPLRAFRSLYAEAFLADALTCVSVTLQRGNALILQNGVRQLLMAERHLAGGDLVFGTHGLTPASRRRQQRRAAATTAAQTTPLATSTQASWPASSTPALAPAASCTRHAVACSASATPIGCDALSGGLRRRARTVDDRMLVLVRAIHASACAGALR